MHIRDATSSANNHAARFFSFPSGGGIGGLTLAVALASVHDVHVDIYEAAQRFTEIGAGVGMWLRTWKIMQTLGLAPALEGIANRVPDKRPRKCFSSRPFPLHATFFRREGVRVQEG